MPIHKYLDLSTRHLTEQEALDITAAPGVRVLDDEYGAWVNVPVDFTHALFLDTIGELRDDGFPNLAAILTLASTQGCAWVQIDRDADVVDGLPVYNW